VDEHQPSAPAYPPTESEAKLAKLEERLRHELMDDEGRQELWDRAGSPPPSPPPSPRRCLGLTARCASWTPTCSGMGAPGHAMRSWGRSWWLWMRPTRRWSAWTQRSQLQPRELIGPGVSLVEPRSNC
jgi:hypothetical protein